MACQFCIARQQALVRWFCKKSDGRLCQKAKERLERMLKQEK